MTTPTLSNPTVRRFAPAILWTLAAFAAPYILSGSYERYLIALSLMYTLLAVSWNITLGYGGMFNFAHIAFFGIGAYAVGISTTEWSWTPWGALLFATVAGGFGAALSYAIVIRMRGIYVALVTFVFAEVLSFVVTNGGAATGGSSGLVGIPSLSLGHLQFITDGGLGYCLLLAAMTGVTLTIVILLRHSGLGLRLIALRDAEPYAISRGISPFATRMQAFVISGLIAGATGGVFALYFGTVSPSLFGFAYLTLVLSMMFVGGIGTTFGPAFGGIIIAVLSDRLKNFGPTSSIIIGAIILLILWFMPGGFAGLIRASHDHVDRNSSRRRRLWYEWTKRGNRFTKMEPGEHGSAEMEEDHA